MIYIAQFGTQNLYKIGYTQGKSKKQALKRIASLQTGSPLKLSLHSYVRFVGIDIEQNLHKTFHNYRVSGEWFLLSEEQLNKALNDVNKENPKAKVTKVQTLQKVTLDEDIALTKSKHYKAQKPIQRLSFFQRISYAWQEFKFAFMEEFSKTE